MAPVYAEEGIKVINQSCVHKEGVKWDKVKFHNISKSPNPAAVLNAGDVLINSTGTGTLGRVCLFQPRTENEGEQVIADGHVTIIRVNSSQLLPQFLFYLLCDKQEEITLFASEGSTNQIELSRAKMGDYVVPVPSLEEQQEIVAHLDRETARLDELRAEKERFLDLLERKRAALIAHAVTGRLTLSKAIWRASGEGYFLPEHWLLLPIKRVLATKITDGPHETPTIYESGIPFLSAEAVKNYKLDFNLKRGFISQQDHERFSQKCKPQRGDIFMVKSGATTGNIAVVETDETFDIWSPLALVRPDEEKVSSKFLFYSMIDSNFRDQVELSWSFGTQQNIGMGVIENLKIPVPPLDEQRAIVAHLERVLTEMDELKIALLNSLELLNKRRAALIAHAVSGV